MDTKQRLFRPWSQIVDPDRPHASQIQLLRARLFHTTWRPVFYSPPGIPRYRAGDDASRVSPAIPKQQFATEASSRRSDSRPHRLGDWVGPRPPRSRARAQRFVFELGDRFAGSGRHGSAQAARAEPPGSGSSTSWKRSRSKRLQPARPVRPQISNRPRADRGRRTLPTRSHRPA